MVWTKHESRQNIWLPDHPGDGLIGEVMDRFEGKFGSQLTIRDELTKTEVNTPSHKVLQNLLEDVTIGARVRITYKGEEPPKVRGQSPMKMYEVETDEPEDAAATMAPAPGG